MGSISHFLPLLTLGDWTSEDICIRDDIRRYIMVFSLRSGPSFHGLGVGQEIPKALASIYTYTSYYWR
jgi:hypothetical protein